MILLSNIQYSQKHNVINHCDRRITHLGHFNISFVLLDISSKFLLHLECWLLSPNRHIKWSKRLNTPKGISVSLRKVIRFVVHLSQWIIMLCLWLYCISITNISDMSITVIYHCMSLTVLYQDITLMSLCCHIESYIQSLHDKHVYFVRYFKPLISTMPCIAETTCKIK